MKNVLIVDDEESICWGLSKLCSQLELASKTASTAERGLELARSSTFELIVLDVRLPGIDGITAISQFKNLQNDIPIIIITAFGDLETAIDAIQQGAFEYIVKPFDLNDVRSKILQALATSDLRRNAHGVQSPESSAMAASLPTGFIGSSPLMQEVYKQIALTTTSESPVLITGESGTGKELAARSIHEFGNRSQGPFVAINIAALNPSLVESELFGHCKGAFTGADHDRTGLIQQANGGTLFLDEIAEVPLTIQVKLLRVLDTKELTPVGGNQPITTDFRLVSATHQDLLSQINHGEFRQDLLYRLRTFEIRMPPLRSRLDDIPELVAHFLRHATESQIVPTEEFIDKLRSWDWPGNVRELQSTVQRAAALARGGFLKVEHVEFQHDLTPSPSAPPPPVTLSEIVSEWTRQEWTLGSCDAIYEKLVSEIEPAILKTAFEMSNRQYSAAARRLGIHRTTLKKKLDELEANEREAEKRKDNRG